MYQLLVVHPEYVPHRFTESVTRSVRDATDPKHRYIVEESRNSPTASEVAKKLEVNYTHRCYSPDGKLLQYICLEQPDPNKVRSELFLHDLVDANMPIMLAGAFLANRFFFDEDGCYGANGCLGRAIVDLTKQPDKPVLLLNQTIILKSKKQDHLNGVPFEEFVERSGYKISDQDGFICMNPV